MKAPAPLKISIPERQQPALAASPIKLASHQLSPEERNLQALDLAVKSTPLTIPAMSIQRPSAHTTQRDLEMSATRPAEDTLVDERGGVYHLYPIIIKGGFGAVRIAVKDDLTVPRRYMFKEMARSNATTPIEDTQGRNKNTINLQPFDEEKLRREIELMLTVGSPLAPQVVLKTEDRVFLGMPPQEGDLFDAVHYIRAQHPHLLRVLARNMMSDVAYWLVPHANKNVSHRDLKLENMLYTHDGHVLVADFGLGEQSVKVLGLEGTLYYLPPEAFTSLRANYKTLKPEHKPYNGIQGDIWALGKAVLQTLVPAERDPLDLDCFYDGTLNLISIRREYSDSGLEEADFLGILDDSLIEVKAHMDVVQSVTDLWRTFIKNGAEGSLPTSSHRALDLHFQNAWREDAALFSLALDLLSGNPQARPSAADIVKAMSHPRLAVTPAEQRALAHALSQRPHAPHQDSGYASSRSLSPTDSPSSSRLVTRNNTAV